MVNFSVFILTCFIQENIESDFYNKVVFYDIEKKPQLPHTIALLEKSAKSIFIQIF